MVCEFPRGVCDGGPAGLGITPGGMVPQTPAGAYRSGWEALPSGAAIPPVPGAPSTAEAIRGM